MAKRGKGTERICGTVEEPIAEWAKKQAEKSKFHNISHLLEVALKNLKKKMDLGEDIFDLEKVEF